MISPQHQRHDRGFAAFHQKRLEALLGGYAEKSADLLDTVLVGGIDDGHRLGRCPQARGGGDRLRELQVRRIIAL